MGYLDNIETTQYIPHKPRSLESKATNLLKEKKPKRSRRGSGIQKKLRKQQEHKKLMEAYKKQKRARAQMFDDFRRHITE